MKPSFWGTVVICTALLITPKQTAHSEDPDHAELI